MPAIRSLTAYQFVAGSLRQQILDGKLAPGTRLSSERELCDRFSASRITIRRALDILAEELLIERRQGIGTFVSPTPSRRIPLLSTDFSGSMTAHAPELKRELESYAWQPANDDVAVALQTFAGASVLFARRLDMLDGEPVAFDEIYLAEQVADRLSESDLAQLRFLERWQVVQGVRLGHLLQRIEAIESDTTQADFLRINSGKPLLKEVDVIHLSTGAPGGLFISYYRHDLFQLTSTVRLSIFSGSNEID